MLEPGASRSTYGDWLEKAETVSLSVVEPTATTLEMQAGALSPFRAPLLPEAATVVMPCCRSRSMMSFMGSSSQGVVLKS